MGRATAVVAANGPDPTRKTRSRSASQNCGARICLFCWKGHIFSLGAMPRRWAICIYLCRRKSLETLSRKDIQSTFRAVQYIFAPESPAHELGRSCPARQPMPLNAICRQRLQELSAKWTPKITTRTGEQNLTPTSPDLAKPSSLRISFSRMAFTFG